MNIQFKGQATYNNEWIYGDLIHYENGQMAILKKPFSQYGCEATEICKRTKVIPETVTCVQVEEILKKFEERNGYYEKIDNSRYLYYDARQEELEQCLTELKEAFK